jgi:lipoic acid synthetase
LALLTAAKEAAPGIPTKTGLMLGLGESSAEVIATLLDIRATGCDYLSIGQYLAPSKNHHPVATFIEPAEFDRYRDKALALGFAHVESAPYVRSSYHAERYTQD